MTLQNRHRKELKVNNIPRINFLYLLNILKSYLTDILKLTHLS